MEHNDLLSRVGRAWGWSETRELLFVLTVVVGFMLIIFGIAFAVLT